MIIINEYILRYHASLKWLVYTRPTYETSSVSYYTWGIQTLDFLIMCSGLKIIIVVLEIKCT